MPATDSALLTTKISIIITGSCPLYGTFALGSEAWGFGCTIWGLRVGVWGVLFGVRGLGSGVFDLGFEVRIWGLGFAECVRGGERFNECIYILTICSAGDSCDDCQASVHRVLLWCVHGGSRANYHTCDWYKSDSSTRLSVYGSERSRAHIHSNVNFSSHLLPPPYSLSVLLTNSRSHHSPHNA